MKKQCLDCLVEKNSNEFEIRKDTGKRRNQCRACKWKKEKARFDNLSLTEQRRRKQHREKWRRENKERVQQSMRGSAERVRKEVKDAYGGKCKCCGEKEHKFLTIDHVNNDGSRDRKKDRNFVGLRLYYLLRRDNYPKDKYQLLCYNCNCAKEFWGKCPHKKL